MMTDPEGAPTRGVRFMQAAERVADLDSPFYDEERHRDVWNEASAVGFQLMLWLALAVAAAMVWVGQMPGVPYAMSVVALATAGGIAAHEYAARKGVPVEDTGLWDPTRTAVHSLLVAILGAGMVRAWWMVRGDDTGAVGSFLRGFTAGAGAALVVVAAVFVVIAFRRRDR